MTASSPLADISTPYWWEAPRYRPPPSGRPARELDVAIVGAGYAGLAAGLTLARAGRSVAAFDAMVPGEGASTRNGGIASGNIRPSFSKMVRTFGEAQALAIEAEGKAAREFLHEFIKTVGLDCDFQLTGLFKGALGYDQYDKIARDAETLARKLGIETHAVPHAEQQAYIGTDFYRGGTVRMDIGGLHPAKFHAELLRVAIEAGLAVHAETPVRGITREGAGFRVDTAAGEVRAKKVLVCTNGYSDKALPWLRRRLIPVRSRMIATEPLPADVMARLMPRKMMMGERRELGFYYRPSPDGTRILLGGRDSSRKGDPAAPTLRLRQGLVEIFPELKNVRLTHSWFGNVAMNRDMVPRIFEHDGVLYATSFCGSGVVWAPWVGTRAAHRLMGHEKEARTGFDFRPPAALPFYRGDPWFMPLIIRGYAMQDWLAMRRARR